MCLLFFVGLIVCRVLCFVLVLICSLYTLWFYNYPTEDERAVYFTYFSSPEPKAQDELIGWDSSQSPPVRPFVCPHFLT